MIAIIDYGMGNIHSVEKALASMGADTMVTNKAEVVKTSDKVVLPGVGAFSDAISELERQNLIFVLKEHIKNKKSFLGICLGMQLLFEVSEEGNESKGLAILKGMVKKFEAKIAPKVPHMGWNQLKISATKRGGSANNFGGKNKTCPLLKDLPDNSYVYFCHSYYPKPNNENIIAAATDYGIDFASVIWQDNIYGVQFHPEKSQNIGLKIIENFVNLC